MFTLKNRVFAVLAVLWLLLGLLFVGYAVT